MIDQLKAIEHRRVDLVTAKKTDTQTKLTEWRSANSKLLALKTAAIALRDPDSFQVFSASMTTNSSTVKASDLLSVTTATEAAPGTYTLKVTNLAQSQKLSSNPFTSRTTELGSGFAGDLVINGRVVSIKATDTLAGVANSINNLNSGTSPSGVTASVVNFGANDYRLILTSDTTGAQGISLLNGSAVDLAQAFGWKDNQTAAIKNSITSGAQSDRFTSANTAIGSLLGLTAGQSAGVTIGDRTVALDLSTMSLTNIKDAINTAAPTGVSASVISQTVEGVTYNRLQIDGTQTFTDASNLLNTLGLLDHNSAAVAGKVSGISMTSDGAKITAATLLKDIDGYNTFTAGGSPAGDYLTLTGTSTANGAVNAALNITSTSTVQDLLNEIKTRYGDVLAYVTSDGKIRVDDLSGGSVLSVNLTDHIADMNSKLEFVAADADFGAASARLRQIIAGEDATIEIDGVAVTNASNTIKAVIAGTTLNLVKEDATTVNLTIGRDLTAIKNNINNFVTKYNEVMSYINTQFSYNSEEKKTGGVLFGDGTLSSVKAEITALLNQTVWGVNTQFSTLSLIGITMDNALQLSVNDSVLTGYLQTNFNDVKALFSAQGATSSTDLVYVSNTRDAKAGEYVVHVNSAATRGTATGSEDLLTGGAADTLTVTQGGSTATIVITADMTLADIVNALNTEFSALTTRTLSAAQELKQDDNATAITAGTTWDNIFGTTLQGGDTIAFSGTSRSGASLSGSYTITTVGTETVQGLLSAIETTFSNQVKASIDSSGRITVTDKFSGASQLALDITEPGSRGLDFGTVLSSNTGGVVGRYALSLTAANDGSNHLLIRNNNYGSGGSFTISQDTGDLGLVDETYSGLDILGTINGETATGSGQTLTGAADNANTAGLSVKYTGAVDGVDAGTVKLTLGLAELFDRALFGITDPIDGYVGFKQQSLQNSIIGFTTQIEQMEARLNLKMETMINRFVVMETALSKMQTQSNWLSSQLNALSNK
jgi:flagellar hook-associated protein 2